VPALTELTDAPPIAVVAVFVVPVMVLVAPPPPVVIGAAAPDVVDPPMLLLALLDDCVEPASTLGAGGSSGSQAASDTQAVSDTQSPPIPEDQRRSFREQPAKTNDDLIDKGTSSGGPSRYRV